MNRAWLFRSRRSVVVGLVVAVAAGALLPAQTVEEQSDTRAATDPTLTDTVQTAEHAPPANPSETNQPVEASETPRSRFLSSLIGSKHDFSEAGRLDRDLCTPCHTPHLTREAPARLDRRAETTAPLQPYEGIEVELNGWSLLCLGCHDGTMAPGIYSSAHAIEIAGQLGGSRLGTAGLRSHPVGVKYPAAAEAGFHPSAAVEAAGLLLPGGRIQCATCHDPHNTHGHKGMLRISNRRSRVCLTCHRR